MDTIHQQVGRDQAGRMARTPPTRLRRLAALALAISLVVLAAAWIWGRLHPALPTSTPPVPAGRAMSITRHTEVAFADAEMVWRQSLPDGSGRGYDAARLVFFGRATRSPCAGGAEVSGAFYCPETGTATFGMTYLDTLGERLKRQRELGLSLVAARISAEHMQRELGLLDTAALELIGARSARRAAISTELALHADCLTGAWAAAATPRLGQVPAEFYDQLVWSARNVTEDLVRQGARVPAALNPFALGSREARAAAFAQGYAAGRIAGCPAPPDLAPRG